MEMIRHQHIGQNTNAAKSLQATHELDESLRLNRTMPGDLEDEATLYHPGNAVVKPVTVGLDSWEAHQLGGNYNTTNINVTIINNIQLRNNSTCPSWHSSSWHSLFSGSWIGRDRGQSPPTLVLFGQAHELGRKYKIINKTVVMIKPRERERGQVEKGRERGWKGMERERGKVVSEKRDRRIAREGR